jgi:hypothetical protein
MEKFTESGLLDYMHRMKVKDLENHGSSIGRTPREVSEYFDVSVSRVRRLLDRLCDDGELQAAVLDDEQGHPHIWWLA